MPGLKWAQAFPLVVLLGACGSPKTESPPAGQPETDASASASASRVPRRGILTARAGALVFRACGAPPTVAETLIDPRGELGNALTALSAKPEDGIYVELDVAPSTGESLAGIAVLRARGLGEGLPCATPVFDGEFVANGNEPFWAVEIRENGITYRAPDHPKGRTFPYALTRTETGSVVYATKVETPAVSTLEVALEPASCIDSMSGELRGFKAHVILDGRKLEGCAAAGVPRGEFGDAPLDELDRFAGAYPNAVGLWKDPVLETRLRALLGAAMPAFLDAIKVQGPVMKDAGIFYVTGNRPHQGGVDGAVFLADPATDTLGVILLENGARRDFKEGGRDIALPAEVVTMIGNVGKR